MKNTATEIADFFRALVGRTKKNYFTSALIAAGGCSARIGGDTPKQHLPVLGVPAVVRSLLAFQRCCLIDEIIVATRPEEAAIYAQYKKTYNITKLRDVAVGGGTRQESVLAAFKRISPKSEFVAIHDAARCAITPAEIETVAHTAYEHGAAVAAARVSDTVKRADGEGFIAETLDRDNIWLAATPQIIKTDIYRACAFAALRDGLSVTDDCALLEAQGFRIKLCDTGRDNIKITEAGDVERIEQIILKQGEDGAL